MTEYRKKPVVIDATQWFKNGDHPQDYSKDHDGIEGGKLRVFAAAERKAREWEGDVVRYFRHPGVDGQSTCKHCQKIMHVHGWIDTLEGEHIVCPGDWIITGVKGEHYPCKPDIFALTYELVAQPSQPPRATGRPDLFAPVAYEQPAQPSQPPDAQHWKTEYEKACNLVARMHAAAIGSIEGPRRGVVEDVEDAVKAARASPQDAKDAARYRWLRDVGDSTWIPLGKRPAVKFTYEVDAAIDAAMEKT